MSDSSEERQSGRERSPQDIVQEYVELLADYEATDREERLDRLWQEMDEQTKMNLLM